MNKLSVKELNSDKYVPVSGASRSILLVEDDPDAMEELSEILELEGWAPLTARNVAGALAVIENSDVQLVVTDVHLGNGSDPGESGIQLVSRAQAQFPDRNLSFIILSGDTDAVKSSLQTDAVDFLLKPVASDDLIRAIVEAEQWTGKERKLSEFAEYLIRKSERPVSSDEQSPNYKRIATEFDLKRRLAASSDEKSFVIQYVVGAEQLQTWFNPVVDRDHNLFAMEAAPRWVDTAAAANDMQTFLEQARGAEWARLLDDKVRDRATETLASCKASFGGDRKMIVLFPADQLLQDDGVRGLLSKLDGHEVQHDNVLVEATYVPALIDTPDLVLKSHLGCFAGGLLRVDAQNLSGACGFVCRMKDFGFDWVRLNMRSLPDWYGSPDARAEIKALISIAHATGSKVIVDNVHASNALDWLRAQGCDAFQGKAVAEIVAPNALATSVSKEVAA